MEKRLTGKHVLIILLSAFGVVFAVNGFFAYSAIHTLSGEQRGASYEAGLHYNATLAEQRAQEELHWVSQIRRLCLARGLPSPSRMRTAPPWLAWRSRAGWSGPPRNALTAS